MQTCIEKELLREQKKYTTLESSVLTWKQKHADLDKRICEKEESGRNLKSDMSEKSQKIMTLKKRGEREDAHNKTAVTLLEQQRDALGDDLSESNKEVIFWAKQTSKVHSIPNPDLSTSSNPHPNPNPNS